MLDPQQFDRKADFRGIYPNAVNEELAFHVGRYLSTYAKNAVGETAPGLAIGRDGRTSSASLYSALANGVACGGGRPHCVGLATTDMIQWAVGEGIEGVVGGAMITASHNPPQYNGIKLLIRNPATRAVDLVRPNEELRPIWRADGSGTAAVEARIAPFANGGRADVQQRFVEAAVRRLESPSAARGPIVLDAGNGVGGIFPPLLKRAFAERGIDVELRTVFEDIDGSFPNRPPNPGLPGATLALQRTVVETGAAFGAAFDGDADRVFLVDELGQFVPGSQLLGALATRALEKSGPGSVAFAAVCSFSVVEAIRRAGGTPVIVRVGQDAMKLALSRTNAVFGGESSAHYNFPDAFGLDSGLFALMTFWDLLLQTGGTASEALAPFASWTHSGEINLRIECGDWKAMGAAIVDGLRTRFADPSEDCYVFALDGVSVYAPRSPEFPTTDDVFPVHGEGAGNRDVFRAVADGYTPAWWFNVRTSNNEPLVRLNVETQDASELGPRTLALVETLRAFCRERGAGLHIDSPGLLANELL